MKTWLCKHYIHKVFFLYESWHGFCPLCSFGTSPDLNFAVSFSNAMVRLFYQNGQSAQAARRAWIVQYGRGKVPSRKTINLNVSKFQDPAILSMENQHKFVEKVRPITVYFSFEIIFQLILSCSELTWVPNKRVW